MNTRFIITVLIGLFFSTSLISQSEDDFYGKLRTVIIDAGHGGKDNGCSGSKSHEKDIALSIALKLGGYLEEKFENLNVIYTRKTDVFIELRERASIANRAKADLFICIHANSARSSAFGTETFVMGNAKSEANMKAAQRENASILLEDNYQEKYEDFDPNSPESYISMVIMQSASQGQSVAFAEKVQRQFRERVGRKDRGVRQAPLLVLHQTTMPSVLIETGFLTNANEEKFLMSELGQDYIASAIYRAFKEYKLEIEEKSALMLNEKLNTSTDTKEDKPIEVKIKEDKKEKKSNKKEVVTLPKKENEVKKGRSNEIIFKVQLATTTNKISTSPSNFKGLDGVEYYEAGGLFRYTYGAEKSWEAANKLQIKVKESGFEDAFVIAFHNEKRIAVGEAVRLLKSTN